MHGTRTYRLFMKLQRDSSGIMDCKIRVVTRLSGGMHTENTGNVRVGLEHMAAVPYSALFCRCLWGFGMNLNE